MKCPIDQTDLLMTMREGIEIDYCPKCRGIWLDRGELDKIIERSDTVAARAEPTPPPKRPMPEHTYEQEASYNRDYDRRDRNDRSEKKYKKRKKSKSIFGDFLEEVFDF